MNSSHSGTTRLALMAFLIFLLLLAGCDGDKVVETGSNYEVKRLDADVWATTVQAQLPDLARVTDSQWHNLLGTEPMATTDGSGQAQLRGPGCSAVYIYEDSGLVMRPCAKGGGTGACPAGTIVSSSCDVSIKAMPGDVDTIGTWFSVTNMVEIETMLVIVAEGAVQVTPAVDVTYDILDDAQLTFEVGARELGEPVEIEVDPAEGPRFFYTADDARLAEYRDSAALPAARTWLPLEEIAPLRLFFQPEVPDLEIWLEHVWQQAADDGLAFPPLPSLDEVGATNGVIVVAGTPQAGEQIAESVLFGAEWQELLNARQPISLPPDLIWWPGAGEPPLVLADIRRAGYNPERSRQLLAEAGYPEGLPALLLVPPGGADADPVAMVVDQLISAGIQVEVVELSWGEAFARVQDTNENPETMVIWLAGLY